MVRSGRWLRTSSTTMTMTHRSENRGRAIMTTHTDAEARHLSYLIELVQNEKTWDELTKLKHTERDRTVGSSRPLPAGPGADDDAKGLPSRAAVLDQGLSGRASKGPTNRTRV